MYTIGQFSKQTGLTVRALRFYDKKGILKPSFISESGHRYYDEDSIITAQKIILFKSLDYSLEEVEEMIAHDEDSLLHSLKHQKQLLEKKRDQIERVISKLDHAIDLGERNEIIDIPIFLSVIYGFLKEEEQKEYLKAWMPAPLIERIFGIHGEELIELNSKVMTFIYRLKEAYANPIPDDELKVLIKQLYDTFPQDLLEDVEIALKDNMEIKLDNAIFPSLFTKKEDQWLQDKIEEFRIGEEILQNSKEKSRYT